MIFKGGDLWDLIDESISEKAVGNRRWGTEMEYIFPYIDKYYRVVLLLQPEEGLRLNDSDEIDCPEVHLVEETVKVWKPV